MLREQNVASLPFSSWLNKVSFVSTTSALANVLCTHEGNLQTIVTFRACIQSKPMVTTLSTASGLDGFV